MGIKYAHVGYIHDIMLKIEDKAACPRQKVCILTPVDYQCYFTLTQPVITA